MNRTLLQTRLLSAAGLLLLLAGGSLAWRSVIHHRDSLATIQAKLSERTQERDRLHRELAAERQRLRSLEQVWSAKLELAHSEKTAADQKLRECDMRGVGNSEARPSR
jgi:hypothetical protein